MTRDTKTFPRSRMYLLLAATTLFGLAGCGSDSDSDSKTEPDITKPDIETPAEAPTRKVLVIGIDGLMYEYIDAVDDPELNEPPTPNFSQFTLTKSFAGGLLNTSSHQPSYSGPSWSSILTGTWVDAHGVNANNGKAVAVPSIFSTLKQRDPSLNSGSFAAWTPINSGHLVKEMPHIDRRVDGAYRPDGESLDKFITDQLVAELETEDSNLNFIFTHLDEVDGAGHACGWCERYETSLSTTDEHLGRVMAAIDQRELNFNEEWLVMVVSDHGHRPAGGHGGDTVVERTSVIGVNRPELFNEFLTTPAAPLPLSDSEEQNTLMGYPAITTVVPTAMAYLGHDPVREDQFASPSLIGELGAYKLITPVEQDDMTAARVNLSWQTSDEVSKVTVYRGDEQIGEVSAAETRFTDTVTVEDMGEGTHTLVYSIQGDIGNPVSSRAQVSLAEPVDLSALLAERESLASFNGTIAPYGWVSEASATPTYVDGPFSGVKAVNLKRSQGYLSQAKDLSGYDQISFGFRFRVNGSVNGDPNILSNKNFASGLYRGMVVTARNDSIKLNIGDGSHRADTAWMPLAKDQWVFAVVSIDLTNNEATLFTQDAKHGFQAARVDTGSVSSLSSPFPLNVGEGGNGTYNVGRGLNLDMADLVTFDRALTESEARALANTTAPLGGL